jgi:hypothetical protein
MLRLIWVLVAICVTVQTCLACSICGGSFATRTTLREKLAQSVVVVEGTLKNAKPNTDDTGGTTEFHFGTTLKTTEKWKDTRLVVLPKYYPTIGSTPARYLIFFEVTDDKLLMIHGVESTAALTEFLQVSAKLAKTGPQLLAQAFTQLEHPDALVASEAFLEFALASDADIAAAKKQYDPKKLRAWINAKDTPIERIGVYAILLGLCGDATTDAPAFKKWMTEERFGTQLSGLIAGMIQLDAKAGWANLNVILSDTKLPFTQRLSALLALRFLQATVGPVHRADIVKACGQMVTDAEFADLVIDDLRRWAWWDHTEKILASYNATSPKILKRTIVRYALQCPEKPAAVFIAKVRATEPDLVKKVEDTLKP